MNIAFVHYAFINGGLERITLDIIKFLSNYGDQYKIFLYSNIFNDEKRQELENLSVKTRELRNYKLERSEDVERFINEDKIDLVVQSSSGIKDIDQIKKRTGVKVIFANHGEPFWERYCIIRRRQSTPMRRLRWKLYRKKLYELIDYPMRRTVYKCKKEYMSCDAYTVLCEPYKEQMCKAFRIEPEKSHMYAIENPEYIVENPQLEKENIILFCGRLENTSKRLDQLLMVWSKVQDRLPDWKLQLVGDGPQEKELKTMAGNLGLERIEFTGVVQDTSPFYRKASIVCLTSQSEGWGLALTEGQANGCIPIAFACSAGVETIIGHSRKYGFLVEPGNIEAYAETLVKVAGMPEEQKLVMRKAAINKRSEYTPEIIGARWKALFDKLVPIEIS